MMNNLEAMGVEPLFPACVSSNGPRIGLVHVQEEGAEPRVEFRQGQRRFPRTAPLAGA
jgi:hypothetical protein